MVRPLQIPVARPGPGNRRARELHRRQYAVIDDILARSPRPGQPSYDAGRDDLVPRLREAYNPETGDPISEGEIRDQALIFLMAGHETTAGALTFTLHLLGRHHEVQDQVAEEIRDVIRNEPVPTPDQIRRLTLTRAALLEGMRLFPSARATERVTATEVTLGGYRLQPTRSCSCRRGRIVTRTTGRTPRSSTPIVSSAHTTGRAAPTSRWAADLVPAWVSTSPCSRR